MRSSVCSMFEVVARGRGDRACARAGRQAFQDAIVDALRPRDAVRADAFNQEGPVARELVYFYRIKLDHEGKTVPVGGAIRRPTDAVPIFARLLAPEPVEVFGMLGLDTRGHVIGWREVSRGGIDRAYAAPAEVLGAAALMGAARVICGHNHPSGDPTPSTDDLALTHRLIAAGDLLGIPVIDHLIIGTNGFTSLASILGRAGSPGATH